MANAIFGSPARPPKHNEQIFVENFLRKFFETIFVGTKKSVSLQNQKLIF